MPRERAALAEYAEILEALTKYSACTILGVGDINTATEHPKPTKIYSAFKHIFIENHLQVISTYAQQPHISSFQWGKNLPSTPAHDSVTAILQATLPD